MDYPVPSRGPDLGPDCGVPHVRTIESHHGLEEFDGKTQLLQVESMLIWKLEKANGYSVILLLDWV